MTKPRSALRVVNRDSPSLVHRSSFRLFSFRSANRTTAYIAVVCRVSYVWVWIRDFKVKPAIDFTSSRLAFMEPEG